MGRQHKKNGKSIHYGFDFLSISSFFSSFRIIFPVAVMGSSSTNSISRGYSWAARRTLTKSLISTSIPGSGFTSGLSTIKAFTIWVRILYGLPTTVAMATDGCFIRQSSIFDKTEHLLKLQGFSLASLKQLLGENSFILYQ